MNTIEPLITYSQTLSVEDPSQIVAPDKGEIKKHRDVYMPGYETRIEQAEMRSKQAEKRSEQAEARSERAEIRWVQAEARSEQAEARSEQAEMRTEQAGVQSERALRASELRYRRIFEASKDGILILDGETGRISDVNPFLVELLGLSHSAMVGKTVAELEQRVAERTAQLQNVNEELGAFSYSVSHDLRAPLRHVVGFVELLQRDAGLSLSGKSLHHLKTISESAQRMGDLIDDLLAFSRIGQSEMQKTEFNIEELVRETLGEFRAETKERNIAWTIHAMPAVWADVALLRLVLVNLISNAVKFTGGRTEARIEIGCAPSGNGETVIFIRDNGAGFDPKYTGKLFGVFQRLHSQDEFEGTGIGLANVQRIIHRHGGRAWAEGVVDGGATFYFSIPKRNEVINGK